MIRSCKFILHKFLAVGFTDVICYILVWMGNYLTKIAGRLNSILLYATKILHSQFYQIHRFFEDVFQRFSNPSYF